MKIQDKINLEQFQKHLPLLNLLTFFSILLISYFVLSPFYSFILRQEKEIQTKKDNLSGVNISLDQFSKLKDEFPNLSSEVAVLDKIAKNQKDTEQFLAQIEKIAKKSNLLITSFTPETNEEKVTATLNLSGSNNDFKKFLETLEENQLIIEITSLSFNEGEGATSFTLKVNVSGA